MLNNNELDRIELMFSDNYSDQTSSMIGALNLEQLKTNVAMYRHAIPDLRFEIVSVLSGDSGVAVHWSANGHQTGELRGIPPSGKITTVSGTTVFRVSGERIHESWGNWDALGMLIQLGIVSMDTLPWNTA